MNLHVVRRNNLLSLYSEFVASTLQNDPSKSTHGLDRDFAALLQIANSSLSSYKTGGRPIGDRIARQIETLAGKASGWLDVDAVQPIDEETELQQFLKLAARAYKRLPSKERPRLFEMLKATLDGRAQATSDSRLSNADHPIE